MKKIIAVILITILFILLSHNRIAFADTTINPDNYNTIIYVYTYDNNPSGYILIADTADTLYIYRSGNYGIISRYSNSLEIPMFSQYYAQPGSMVITPGYNSSFVSIDHYIVYKGTLNTQGFETPEQSFDNWQEYEDYINPPPEPTTWYEDLYDSFLGVIEAIASIATGGLSDLVEAFTDFWTVKVGGDEGDMFFPTDIIIASPTPTPTPIQYQTVIAPTTDPQGNVVYEYKYVYNNPSGTPIITSSPPINNNNGDSFDYPYYDNPDNRNNPYKLKIPWYLKLIFGNKIVDETTLDDSVNVIQDYMNDDDINNGVTTVYDGMSAIPTDWLILIGVIASIPLFGCFISRLLS